MLIHWICSSEGLVMAQYETGCLKYNCITKLLCLSEIYIFYDSMRLALCNKMNTVHWLF